MFLYLLLLCGRNIYPFLNNGRWAIPRSCFTSQPSSECTLSKLMFKAPSRWVDTHGTTPSPHTFACPHIFWKYINVYTLAPKVRGGTIGGSAALWVIWVILYESGRVTQITPCPELLTLFLRIINSWIKWFRTFYASRVHPYLNFLRLCTGKKNVTGYTICGVR